jgi:transposase InsO family protein/transposase
MEVHANAPLSPIGRRRVVDRVIEQGWSVAAAAEAAGVTERTVYRWLARWRAAGQDGLVDRCSAALRIPHKTPPDRVSTICALRQLRLTAVEIAEQLTMPISTVCAVLAREGLGKLSRLQPPEPVNRYERSAPGELIHIDIKRLGRIARPGHRVLGGQAARAQPGYHRKANQLGWEYLHVAVDDYSRLAYAEVLDDQTAVSAIAFLRRALAFFASHAITVQRVMTDNGSAYVSGAHRIACAQLGVRHLRTRPYRPRTNGKAERLIQTLLRRWAYRRPYTSSAERTAALQPWLDHYNHTRPHGSLNKRPPISRLTKAPGNDS